MNKLYYTPPPDEIFNGVKEKAIEIWKTYNDDYGYATDKINEINGMGNIQDNVMFIVAMFDINNQERLADKLSPDARKAIRERMVDGGSPEYLIKF